MPVPILRLALSAFAVLAFDAPWMKSTGRQPTDDAALIRALADGGFDAAVIFTVYSQNPLPAAYLTYLAGIPRRLAHCRGASCRKWAPRAAEAAP